MTQRERFNLQKRSLESLFANTSRPFHLVIVDGGSPRSLAKYLRKLATTRQADLIRRDYFLAPNEARNLALPHLRGRYVVFVDNDVMFTPDWLEPLLRTSAETGADILAPLVCIGHPPHTVVHIAGGEIVITEASGRRELKTRHRYMDHPVADVREALQRQPCDFATFHCMFVRRAVFDTLGGFDEKLKTAREHTDFCMTAAGLGAKIMFEPGSVVTYYAPPPLTIADFPFYIHRWNDEWGAESLQHFMCKWDCCIDADRRRPGWIGKRRDLAMEPWRLRIEFLVGWRISHMLKDWVERIVIGHARARRPESTPTRAPGIDSIQAMISRRDADRGRGTIALRPLSMAGGAVRFMDRSQVRTIPREALYSEGLSGPGKAVDPTDGFAPVCPDADGILEGHDRRIAADGGA
jgi:hypothetical protein